MSIDTFVSSFEAAAIDMLHQHGLLTKFNRDVKRVLFFVFTKHFVETTLDQKQMLYYAGLSTKHDLLEYFPKEQLEPYIHKICKIFQKLTNRIIFVNPGTVLPDCTTINSLDGDIVDRLVEISLKRPPSYKTIHKTLQMHKLDDYCHQLMATN